MKAAATGLASAAAAVKRRRSASSASSPPPPPTLYSSSCVSSFFLLILFVLASVPANVVVEAREEREKEIRKMIIKLIFPTTKEFRDTNTGAATKRLKAR
jgi:hypothetical protein